MIGMTQHSNSYASTEEMLGKAQTIQSVLVTCLQGRAISSHWNSVKSKILIGTVFTEINYKGKKKYSSS